MYIIPPSQYYIETYYDNEPCTYLFESSEGRVAEPRGLAVGIQL